MRNHQTTQSNSSQLLVSPSGFRNVPPTTFFVDQLFEDFFPEDESDLDILAGFDYEAFLRREGLSC